MRDQVIPDDHEPVVVIGGGPVGLSVALELNFHGIRSLVVEPRVEVSHARPRAKTSSARAMELFRRWGVAAEIRSRAPLSPAYSSDVVFCTSVTGREVSRFTGTLGIGIDAGGLTAEGGQQVGQHVVEETLRDAVLASQNAALLLGWRATAVSEQGDGCAVTIDDGSGGTRVLRCRYLVGADGAHSVVRAAIGARYEAAPAGRPNLSIVFRLPGLAERIPHGPAVHYWVLNPAAPGVVGPMDPADDVWWAIATGRTAGDTNARRGHRPRPDRCRRRPPGGRDRSLAGEVAAGRPPTGAGACSWQVTPPTRTRPGAVTASTPGWATRSIWAGSSPPS